MVAAAVLIAYACAGIIFLPFLRRELSIGLPDIVIQIWPVGPALVIGIFVTSLLPASLGGTMIGLVGRRIIYGHEVVCNDTWTLHALPLLP